LKFEGEVQCHAISPKQLVYCLLVQKYILMGSDKQSGSPRPLLGTLKMGRVRTILTHTYPYPHEHSRHIMTAVIIACLFFISSDNMHTLIHKLDNNIKWWSMYVCLIGFFYFFSSPFLGRTIQPSYSNFNRWYVLHFRLLHNSVLISLVGLVPVDHRSSMLLIWSYYMIAGMSLGFASHPCTIFLASNQWGLICA